MMLPVAITLVGGVIVINLVLILFWQFNFRRFECPPLTTFPRVAILLAVRNEAHYLPSCLDHLLRLDYPKDQLQIWVGNDMSDDDTLAIAQRYAQQDGRIRVVDITSTMGEARAKANAIAHLVQASTHADLPADVLLITDADVHVTPGWAQGMICRWQAMPSAQPIGIVTGVTVVAGNSAGEVGQRIDWLSALGMVKVASDLGIPVATLGNNMLLYRPAYEATGGYEAMPFSITEDFQILHQTVAHGYHFRSVIDADTRVMTQPMPTLSQLLQQRKRWTHGALQLPFYLVAILLMQALFYPLLVYTATQEATLAFGLWITKTLSHLFFVFLVIKKLRLPSRLHRQTLRYLPAFELYSSLLSFVSLLYYLVPIRVVWKGRSFVKGKVHRSG